MNHPMRKKERELSKTEALRIIEEGEYGVLSTCGADGYPYGVPLSYAYADGKLFFHGAFEGHKIENLSCSPKASFTVVGDTHVLTDIYSTAYESAIAFGNVHMNLDDEMKVYGLRLLVEKYTPDNPERGYSYAKKALPNTNVYYMEIEEITGKRRGQGR